MVPEEARKETLKGSLESKGKRFLLFLASILSIAFCLSVSDIYRWKSIEDNDVRSFQRLTGGLGMGAIVSPIWDVMDFDPRLKQVHDVKLGPIPGGYCYSPSSSSSVTNFYEHPSAAEGKLLLQN